MLILGILLVLLAIAIAAVAVFLTDGSDLELAGQAVEPVTLFVLGAVTVAVLVLGWMLIRTGTRRGLQHRRERKELEELNAKLGRVGADQRRDRDRDGDRDGDPTT